jgi:TonB family protein
MLSRRAAIFLVAMGSALLSACQSDLPAPTDLETVRTSSDAYLAYAREDCASVERLVDPERLDTWALNEMRYSTLLLRGFCSELGGDTAAARDVYRRLILEAPNSFASNDAVERTRTLKLIENNADFEDQIRTARERLDPDRPRRTPVDRVPAEYPPLAKARGIGGFAIVEFGITERGDTENPIVVDSSPPLLFDGSAIRAVRRWQYKRQSSTGDDDRQLIRILFQQEDDETVSGPETAGESAEDTTDLEVEEPATDQGADAPATE